MKWNLTGRSLTRRNVGRCVVALVFATSCSSSGSPSAESAAQAPTTAVAPQTETTLAAPVNTDAPVATKEPTYGIEGVPLGLPAADLERRLGVPPSTKSKPVLEGATGDYVSTWVFADLGVRAKMSSAEENLAPTLSALTITPPALLKTPEEIGIGSAKDAVTAAYGPAVNAEESTPQRIVVGSVFGGIIFTMKNEKVSEIFVGAAAE